MQARFRNADVRTFTHQGRRQADRQILRQLQCIEIECRILRLRREFAQIDGQLRLRLRQRLVQGRQLRSRGGDLAFGDEQIAFRFHPGLELLAAQIQLLLKHFDDFVGGIDLATQGGFADAGGDHVGHQAQVSRIELVTLFLGESRFRLDRATHATEKIKRVADFHGGVVEGVGRVHRHGSGIAVLPIGADRRIERRQQGAAGNPGILPRLTQRRLGRGDGRAVGQRLFDAPIQLRVGERPPPLRGHVLTLEKALRVAGGQVCRCRGRRECIAAVAGCFIQSRRAEIGPDCTTADPARNDQQASHAQESRHHASDRQGRRTRREMGKTGHVGIR